jgi:anti-sigma B factor antagonist
MRLTTAQRKVDGVNIVDITGRIILGEESAALRHVVNDLLASGEKKILLNMAHVDYIDSSGLGYLVSAFTSAKKQGGELKLLNLAVDVKDVMQITRLYIVFEVFEDEATAVKSYNKAASA